MKRAHFFLCGMVCAVCVMFSGAAQAGELDTFLAQIADPSPHVRTEAWTSAHVVGAPAIAPLAELAEAGDPAVGHAALKAIETIAAHAGRPEAGAEREAAAQALAEAIQASSDDQVRRELLHCLGLVATHAETPLLGSLLLDPAVGEDARIALERMPGTPATRALVAGLQAASPDVQIRLAAALGHRGAPEAVSALRDLAQSSGDRSVVFACLQALGKLGVAPHRVFPQRPALDSEARVHYVRAALDAAYHLRNAGNNAEAAAIYENVTVYSNEPAHLREALLGLEAAGAEAFPAQALGYLFHPGVSAEAYRALVTSQLPELDERLIQAYERSEPPRQAAVLRILYERESAALPDVLEAARASDSPEVRATALVISGQQPALDDVLAVAKTGSEWTRPHALELARERITALMADGEIARARDACIDLLESGLPEEDAVLAFTALGHIPTGETMAFLDGLELFGEEPVAGRVILTPAVREAAQLAYVASAAALHDAEESKNRLLHAAEHSAFPSVTEQAAERLAAMGVDAKSLAQRQGFLTDWEIIGPFPNPDGAAFNRSFLDEAGCTGEMPVEFEGTTYTWIPVETESLPAVVVLHELLEPSEHVAAYAYTEFSLPEPREVLFLIGSDDGCEFWVNGEKLHAVDTPRGLTVDEDRVSASLVEGTNRVLIKVLQGGVDWQFCVRVVDLEGKPLNLSQ